MFDPGNYTPHYVENLCSALSSINVLVELVTSPPLFEGAELTHPFPVHNLFFLLTGGSWRTFLRRRTRLRQGFKVLSYPVGLWRTWEALKAYPPGILHVQWALMPALDALLLWRLRSRGWRVVFTAHNLVSELGSPWRRHLFRWVCRQSDTVVVHTSLLAQILRKNCSDVVREVIHIPEGISTFPLVPDLDRVRARQFLGLDPESPVLLFFGMIKPYKGLEYLLRSLPRVLQEFPRAKLVVAGELIQHRAGFDELIDSLGIRDSVLLKLAYVPGTEVPYLFGAANVVVLPYVEISTSGVVGLAYRYSRPVIATSVGGLPELVRDGETGFLVPSRSEHALADAICRGLRDLSGLANMGERAHNWFEKERSWSAIARLTRDLYCSLPG